MIWVILDRVRSHFAHFADFAQCLYGSSLRCWEMCVWVEPAVLGNESMGRACGAGKGMYGSILRCWGMSLLGRALRCWECVYWSSIRCLESSRATSSRGSEGSPIIARACGAWVCLRFAQICSAFAQICTESL
eukprot:gene8522-biopygen19648